MQLLDLLRPEHLYLPLPDSTLHTALRRLNRGLADEGAVREGKLAGFLGRGEFIRKLFAY